MRHLVLALAIITCGLCGCSSQRPGSVSAEQTSSDGRFTDESRQAIACMDASVSLELYGDDVFEPQQARCTEKIAYLGQLAVTDDQRPTVSKLRSVNAHLEACHIARRVSASDFAHCMEEYRHLRAQLPGAPEENNK